MADLLTAKLSGQTGIELVERDRLAEATRELKLAELLGSKDLNSRIKLGALLGADVLLFLTVDEADPPEKQPPAAGGNQADAESPIIRIVVSECVYGLRLDASAINWKAENAEKIADEIRDRSEAVRKRYVGGLKQIVAVSPFLSRDLVSTHYHLQQGFRLVLEQALLDYPGLALVETDEAHQLAIELNRTGGQTKRAVPPMFFVEGEYQAADATAKPTPFNATLAVSDASEKLRTFTFERKLESAIAARIGEEVASEIARLGQMPNIKLHSRQEQSRLLNRRAGMFEEIGDFKTAIALREAAILLDPRNFDSRTAVIDDLKQLRQDRSTSRYQITKGRLAGRWALSSEKYDKHKAYCDDHVYRHIRDCLAHKLVNWREAAALYRAAPCDVIQTTLSHPTPTADELAILSERMERFLAFHDEMAVLGQSLDERIAGGRARTPFHWLQMKQPNEVWHRQKQRDAWYSGLIERLISLRHSFPRNVYQLPPDKPFEPDRPIAARIISVLTELPSEDDLPISAAVRYTMPFTNYVGKERIGMHGMPTLFHHPLGTELEQQIIQSLAASKRPINSFHANCFRLWLRVYRTDLDRQSLAPIAEIKRLRSVAKEQGYGEEIGQRLDSLENFVRRAAKEAEAASPPIASSKHPVRTPVKPTSEYTLKAKDWEKRRDPNPRVRFVPLEGIDADWTGLCACGESLDLMWNTHKVWAMSKPGEARLIFRTGRANEIDQIVWDGKNAWVIASVAIYVVDPNGSMLARIPYGDDLPDPEMHVRMTGTTRNLRIYVVPLEPDRVLVAGSHGDQFRLYVAVIEPDADGKFSSTIIHTGLKRPKNQWPRPGTEPEDDLEMALPVFWTLPFSDPRNELEEDLILIGRSKPAVGSGGRGAKGPRFSDKYPAARPLAVNPKTRTVELFSGRLGFVNEQSEYQWNVYADGQFLYALKCGDLVKCEPVVANGKIEFRETPLLDEPRWGYDRNQWLRYQGFVYSPGAQWGRLNLKTQKYELLNSVLLPVHHRYAFYAVSAHYGLVAWNDRSSQVRNAGHNWVRYNAFSRDHRGTLFQVQIDQPNSVPAELEHIPVEYRTRHAEALKALRQLGAEITIDDQTYSNHEWPGPTKPHLKEDRIREPAPTVVLTKRWKGKDQDLLLMNDLHGPLRLFVHGAPLNNDSLEYVAKIHALDFLGLYDVACDDEGLRHLAESEQLRCLELSGPTGYEFTAKGLAHLQNLPLEELLLSGGGFDDVAAKQLAAIATLNRLALRDDTMSAAAVRELRNRPKLVLQR